MIYLDTGCLVKLYYPEPDSASVAAAVFGKVIIFSSLHELELTNALSLKVFQGRATPEQATSVKSLIIADLEAGSLRRMNPDWEATASLAVDISARHTPEVGCRSLDILHCAQAKMAQAEAFLTTDARQLAVAKAMVLPLLTV